MTASGLLTPAEKLEGEELPNGWTVLDIVSKKPGATGGYFSVGYKVQHADGRICFLKALDWSEAFHSEDPPRKMQELTQTYNFERDLLAKCKDNNLDRVVRALEDGTAIVDGLPVPYLIFELAEGDIRAHMDVSANLDLSWTLRMLHHTAVGVKQLHGVDIAHQDLKPSNILVFQDFVSKLADLGRSAHPDYQPPHEAFPIPGGIQYAAPELRYGYYDPDFKQRRFVADAFLLGNIILFAFTRLTMPGVIYSHLAPEHHPGTWKGTFQEALPYLQSAFSDALESIANDIPEQVRDEIILMLRQLCEPDSTKRGHTKNRNYFSLEQFVTRLNVLAYKAERKLFR